MSTRMSTGQWFTSVCMDCVHEVQAGQDLASGFPSGVRSAGWGARCALLAKKPPTLLLPSGYLPTKVPVPLPALGPTDTVCDSRGRPGCPSGRWEPWP